MKLNLSLFVKELVLFVSAIFLALFSAYRILSFNITIIQPQKFNVRDFFVLIAFAAILILARNKKRFISITYKVLLVLVILAGSQIIFGAFFITPFDLIASLILLSVFLLYKNILTHNIAVTMGIAGVSMIIGLSITPQTVVVLLVILSFYDIISVYKTKHMVSMAKSMIESGAIFGFIIPPRLSGFLSGRKEAESQIGSQFMILGSGDIGLPLIMICSLVKTSLSGAIITSAFSLGGLLITHLIFINQKNKKPMAALPPIATMTIIGYVISLLIT